MVSNNIGFGWCLLLIALLILSCGTKSNEGMMNRAEVDTTLFEKVDSIPVTAKRSLSDTILTIRDDTVRALYYPNTGREVMKLVKGDVCRITRIGRYDVIDGKGNFWIRVERYGGKGWIFGGQTSLASDAWVFSEGITEGGHPYIKYRLNKLSSPSFLNLFKRIGEALRAFEYKEESEGGDRTVQSNDSEIRILETREDVTIDELIRRGPEKDSLSSINYSFTQDGDSKTTFDHAILAEQRGPTCQFVADFSGELKEIFRIGNNYLLIADYHLFNSDLGTVHYSNQALWSPRKRAIIRRQRFGYSGLDSGGYPLFRKSDDGSFISNASCTFKNEAEIVTMQVEETYNRVNDSGAVEENVFFITRYFTFNKTTNQFDETKQEVIYKPK